jgi:phosphatidylserine/phosphatidylglycerophosphate/cardiolipin synthase-like enzyme
MKRDELDSILRQTLDDLRLSRSEKRALGEVLGDLNPSPDDLAMLRSVAFDLARQELRGHENRLVLEWLEEVVKVLHQAAAPTEARIAEAYFTPGDDGPARIVRLIGAARRSLEVCVFTITDDRLSRAVIEAHRRGARVRIITDDDKSFDRGSDIERLGQAGVTIRTDSSEAHMHHKFALIDGRLLLTGSYNWTRGAADENQENFVVVDDPRLVEAYSRTFEDLWRQFGA